MGEQAKEKTYTISIKDHVYEASMGYITECLKMGEQALKKVSDKYIYCVYKDSVYLMCNDTYKDFKSLYRDIATYVKKGFKVYSSKKSL